MKKLNTRLIALFFTLSFMSATSYTQQELSQKDVIIKKLKKAWESKWVKAGTLTVACALTYAIGNQFNLFAPACTGMPDCVSCNDGAQLTAPNNTKLLWKVLGLVGGLVTGIFGYAYLTAQDNNTASAQPVTNNDTLQLQDDFFDFDDEKMAEPLTEEFSINKDHEIKESVAQTTVVEQEERAEVADETDIVRDVEGDEIEDGADDVLLAVEIENGETILPEAQLSEAFLN